MTETLACGYSYESTQQQLSNEYKRDRVKMVFKNLCVLVLWMKEVSALEGLSFSEGKSLVSLIHDQRLHFRRLNWEMPPNH